MVEQRPIHIPRQVFHLLTIIFKPVTKFNQNPIWLCILA
jgi:hypothetical protein